MPALWRPSPAPCKGVNGASLQALSYRDGGLDLKLKTSDAASLERIDQSLRGDGWQAELTSGSAAGGAYRGASRCARRQQPGTPSMIERLIGAISAAAGARAPHGAVRRRLALLLLVFVI